MLSKTALDMTPSMWQHYRPFGKQKKRLENSIPLAEARSVAAHIAEELRKRFDVQKVVIFGSLVHGNFSNRSDIDLAVWGIHPVVFYKAVAFASGFSSVWKVDLVDPEDCPETLLQVILNEGVEI